MTRKAEENINPESRSQVTPRGIRDEDVWNWSKTLTHKWTEVKGQKNKDYENRKQSKNSENMINKNKTCKK